MVAPVSAVAHAGGSGPYLADPAFLVCLVVSVVWPAAATFVVWDARRRFAGPAVCAGFWLLAVLTGPVALAAWILERHLIGPKPQNLREFLAELQQQGPEAFQRGSGNAPDDLDGRQRGDPTGH